MRYPPSDEWKSKGLAVARKMFSEYPEYFHRRGFNTFEKLVKALSYSSLVDAAQYYREIEGRVTYIGKLKPTV